MRSINAKQSSLAVGRRRITRQYWPTSGLAAVPAPRIVRPLANTNQQFVTPYSDKPIVDSLCTILMVVLIEWSKSDGKGCLGKRFHLKSIDAIPSVFFIHHVFLVFRAMLVTASGAMKDFMYHDDAVVLKMRCDQASGRSAITNL